MNIVFGHLKVGTPRCGVRGRPSGPSLPTRLCLAVKLVMAHSDSGPFVPKGQNVNSHGSQTHGTGMDTGSTPAGSHVRVAVNRGFHPRLFVFGRFAAARTQTFHRSARRRRENRQNYLGTSPKLFYVCETAEKMSDGGINPFVVSRAGAFRAGADELKV
jgi:hypothetical protein